MSVGRDKEGESEGDDDDEPPSLPSPPPHGAWLPARQMGHGGELMGNRNLFLAETPKLKQLHLKRLIFGRNQSSAETANLT